MRNTGRAKRDGERTKDEEERDDRSELERETGSRERKLKRGEKRKKKGGLKKRRRRRKGEAEEESQTPLLVAGEEKTRAFLVIASSAPLFEAQRDKRAAIYWSPHIMATFIYFRPFSFCQRLSSVWAKNRNPRCFTKYQSPLLLLYMCVFFIYLLISNCKPPTKIQIPNAEAMRVPFSTYGHIYI